MGKYQNINFGVMSFLDKQSDIHRYKAKAYARGYIKDGKEKIAVTGDNKKVIHDIAVRKANLKENKQKYGTKYPGLADRAKYNLTRAGQFVNRVAGAIDNAKLVNQARKGDTSAKLKLTLRRYSPYIDAGVNYIRNAAANREESRRLDNDYKRAQIHNLMDTKKKKGNITINQYAASEAQYAERDFENGLTIYSNNLANAVNYYKGIENFSVEEYLNELYAISK